MYYNNNNNDDWGRRNDADVPKRKCALHGSIRSQPYMSDIGGDTWTCRSDDVCRTSVNDRLSFSMRDPENAEMLRKILNKCGSTETGICPIKLGKVLRVRAVDPPGKEKGCYKLCYDWLAKRDCTYPCNYAHDQNQLDLPTSPGLTQLLLLLRLPLSGIPNWGRSEPRCLSLDHEEEKMIVKAVESLDPDNEPVIVKAATSLLTLAKKPHAVAECVVKQLSQCPTDLGKLMQIVYLIAVATTSPKDPQAAQRVADGFRHHLQKLFSDARRIAAADGSSEEVEGHLQQVIDSWRRIDVFDVRLLQSLQITTST